ncbi:Animal haem peroxidase [Actinopolyspora xinjiangensis]|uniref:Animal haem peroxidase n=1 Tax=Actinopolyspora xinjiangensis TaxID=405564 RepID=A0A1H0NLF0_9ACTN|nr:heme peroxidase family protein [Actinopolyspora xinjiangensis]SDO93572.1 Animal haem peroxidase [Actinopolyspora xinjiangensis]
MTVHGSQHRGQSAAQTGEVPGRFGKMFPTIEPRKATGLRLAEEFGLPGGRMDAGTTTDEQQNPVLDSGFTFLGQFIDHNITFDPTSSLEQRVDPNALRSFRSPRLDLDHVYGGGPAVNEFLYDGESRQTKLALDPEGHDHARTSDGVALIGDPRNDENLIISQLHLAFAKFHNKVVDDLRAGEITDVFGTRFPGAPEPPDDSRSVTELLTLSNYYDDLLASAQQLVRWHFQWIVRNQFLPLIVGEDLMNDIAENGLRFFDPNGTPFIPVEFAVAGFRFGHATIRSHYRVNDSFFAPIFPPGPEDADAGRTDLNGGPVAPEHTVDWRHFFQADEDVRATQAKRFEAAINTRLLDLPVRAVPGAVEEALPSQLRSLVVRNLLRSETQLLPSGQDVARRIGEIPLSDEELESEGPIYLWYYLLKEAEVLRGGRRLGPVGGRIVAETLVGLLEADPTSYLSVFPRWEPTIGGAGREFGITDLLRYAGVLSEE